MAEDALKGHCPQCDADRNAAVVAAYKEEVNEVVWGSAEFKILKCLGCGTVYVQIYQLCSENIEYDEEGDAFLEPEIKYWPRPVKVKMSIRHFFSVPTEINRLLDEIREAINNNLFSLAAMGIRSALEQIIVDRVGDQGNFIKNVDAFQRAGYLSVRERNTLEALLEAGHAAIHRGWHPTEQDVDTLWEIAGHVLDSVYVHQEQASTLEKKLPSRKRSPER
jgi:hypothetical protein